MGIGNGTISQNEGVEEGKRSTTLRGISRSAETETSSEAQRRELGAIVWATQFGTSTQLDRAAFTTFARMG